MHSHGHGQADYVGGSNLGLCVAPYCVDYDGEGFGKHKGLAHQRKAFASFMGVCCRGLNINESQLGVMPSPAIAPPFSGLVKGLA